MVHVTVQSLPLSYEKRYKIHYGQCSISMGGKSHAILEGMGAIRCGAAM